MSDGRRILVGVIGAPHGVKGDVRLKSYTEEPSTVASFPTLSGGDGRRLTIQAARPLKDDMLVVRFEGIEDRDAAAALTNLQLFVDRRDLPSPDDEEFYHADLIGLAAETVTGEACGRVVALQNFGAGDLLEIAPAAAETFFVPFTKAFVPVVDMPGGRIVLASAALSSETTESDEPRS